MNHEEWQDLCARLGLAVWEREDEAGFVGVGEVGRHELRAGLWAGLVPQPWAQLGLEPALDLGLRGGTVRREEPLPAGHFTIADPRLERRLWLQADEAERARQLLVMRVRDGLFDLLDRRGASRTDAAARELRPPSAPRPTSPLRGPPGGVALRIDDDGVIVEGPPGDELAFFSDVVPTLAGLAVSLDEARAGVLPPHAMSAQHEPCKAFARERGVTLLDTPLRLEGRVGEISLSCSTTRIAQASHAFRIQLTLPEPLGLGLSVEPGGLFDSLASLATGEDPRIGDPAFDRTFSIHSRDRERVRRVLLPEVRGALLAIRARVATFALSDGALELGGSCRAGDAEGIAWLVRSGSAVLEMMQESWRRSTGRQAGPYR